MLGDFAPGYQIRGPIEETIERIPSVDMFVCSETLEHVNDPDAVLRQIRRKADMLLLSTPIGETAPSNNIQHYWGWDRPAIQDMLDKAGFKTVQVYTELVFPGSVYDFQIWAVS